LVAGVGGVTVLPDVDELHPTIVNVNAQATGSAHFHAQLLFSAIAVPEPLARVIIGLHCIS
jgi:hypothetical protein